VQKAWEEEMRARKGEHLKERGRYTRKRLRMTLSSDSDRDGDGR